MFKIRNAIPADASVLAQAEREIAKTPGRLASRPEELKDEAFKEKIISLTNLEDGVYIVIESDGEIIGHAFLEPRTLLATSHVVDLTIAIHEGHQGLGTGKQVMNYLIHWAREKPRIEKMELHVRSSNERAINLYKKLGFCEEGRKTKKIKLGPQQYLDDVYMALWVGN